MWLEKSAAVLPYWGTLHTLTAAYGQLGQIDEAQATWQQMLLDPAAAHGRWMRWSDNPAMLRNRREHFAGGLLKARVVPDLQGFDAWAARQRRGCE